MLTKDIDYCMDCKQRSIDFSRSKRCCSTCLDKRIESSKKYAKSHPDRVKNTRRIWRLNNPDKVIECNKRKRERGSNRIYMIEYRKKNKKSIQMSQKRCIEKRKDYYNDKKRKYYREILSPMSKSSDYARIRRARTKSSGGSFSREDFEYMIFVFGNRCLCCGDDNIKLEADHVVPLSRGGSNYIDNIQPLCRSCNAKKHTQIIDYRREFV